MPGLPAKGRLLSSSPHAFSPVRIPQLMLSVIIALVPTTVYSVYLYGFKALALVSVCIGAALASEFLFRALLKESISIGNLSAVVTGLMLALVLPPSMPLWMAALGSAFAIIVAKEFFGGLGANPFNPALSGRAFLLMSFPAAMTSWTMPSTIKAAADAVSTATPLGLLKEGAAMTDVAQYFGSTDMGHFYRQLFLGNHSGSLGESSIVLIVLGGLFLIALDVIQWLVPLSIVGSVAFFSWILGMDPLFALLSGGVVFGAIFMATDYTTRPLTLKGNLVYGVAIGLLTVIIRKFGGFPEGVTYAILIMNMLTPFLNKLRGKKYGYVPPVKAVKAAKPAKDAKPAASAGEASK